MKNKLLPLIFTFLFLLSACGEGEESPQSGITSLTASDVSVETTSGENNSSEESTVISENSDNLESSELSEDFLIDDGEFYIPYLKADEEIDFSNAPKAEILLYPWNSDYTPYAYAQLVFRENDGFYLFMYCEESNPKTEVTQIGGEVYRDSALEFFCNYYPEGKEDRYPSTYVNLEMNSAGVYLANYRNYPLNALSGARVTVTGETFDGYWTVSAKIPLKLLKDLYRTVEFKRGSFVECNFTKCGSGTDIPHWGTWQPLGGETPNFHQPHSFKLVQIR
ncbi:MAG: hypothetical protein E7614_08865 [Ruminococcaceae bacterium]|nr:hypothetical protein [Oscillospiraceae bacterium]